MLIWEFKIIIKKNTVIHTSYVPKKISNDLLIARKSFFSTDSTVRVHCPVVETHNDLNAVIRVNFCSKTKNVKEIAKLIYDKL